MFKRFIAALVRTLNIALRYVAIHMTSETTLILESLETALKSAIIWAFIRMFLIFMVFNEILMRSRVITFRVIAGKAFLANVMKLFMGFEFMNVMKTFFAYLTDEELI